VNVPVFRSQIVCFSSTIDNFRNIRSLPLNALNKNQIPKTHKKNFAPQKPWPTPAAEVARQSSKAVLNPKGLTEGSRWSFRLFPGTTTGQPQRGTGASSRDARKPQLSLCGLYHFVAHFIAHFIGWWGEKSAR
jgi:hypothetical protein